MEEIVRAMRSFQILAKSGSYTKAAEALGTSQAHIESQIFELECLLCTPLVDRRAETFSSQPFHGPLVLTDCGAMWLSAISRLFGNASDSLDGLKAVLGPLEQGFNSMPGAPAQTPRHFTLMNFFLDLTIP